MYKHYTKADIEKTLGKEVSEALDLLTEKYKFDGAKLYEDIDKALDRCVSDDSKEASDHLWNLLVAAQTYDKTVKGLANSPFALARLASLVEKDKK